MTNLSKLFLLGLAAGAIGFTSCDGTDEPVVVDETLTEDVANATFNASFAANGNAHVADLGTGFGTSTIVTTATEAASATTATDAFFTAANYKGAVDANNLWYQGWSSYANILTSGASAMTNTFTQGANVVVVTSADFNGTSTVTWTKDNVYHLDGFVFVGEGDVLNIEAGTVIKGLATPSTGDNASALVIAKGGYINAVGTAAEPIIMTAEADNGQGMPVTTRGEWGGLIVLGKASLNSTPGTTAIEGIPTGVAEGIYGGTDDTDNSGVIKYVSIRHGGSDIGAGNEINGFTLGGVGSGTTIDYVEVVANKDDGIEWFGGTAQGKHLIVSFCGDDALDYDEGYRGKNQFVIVHQDATADAADRGGEHDGGTTPEDGTPYATPTFYNVTSIGNSGERALTFRDNAGGYYNNSIFFGYSKGIDIEYLAASSQNSYKQFVDGNLGFNGNIFSNIGAGTTAADLFKVNWVQ